MKIKIIKCSWGECYTNNIGEEYEVLREVPFGYVIEKKVYYTTDKAVIDRNDVEIIEDGPHRIDSAI